MNIKLKKVFLLGKWGQYSTSTFLAPRKILVVFFRYIRDADDGKYAFCCAAGPRIFHSENIIVFGMKNPGKTRDSNVIYRYLAACALGTALSQTLRHYRIYHTRAECYRNSRPFYILLFYEYFEMFLSVEFVKKK